VGRVGHVLHFDASERRNVIALFFMLERDRYGFDKKRAGTHYAELVFFQPVDLQITSCIPMCPGHKM
jgi:hypothetical protein